jgi:hypothetical protein
MVKIEDDGIEVTSAAKTEEIKKQGIAGWTKYDELTFSGMQVHSTKNQKDF